uniref:CCR4-NOT transcription complex subunit 10 n=1 Tax=Physcomitrium patens TaxID=3218 RepID=A0A7I4AY17_PHYPA
MAVQVRHNIAVAEYYRDGCTNPQKLLEVLSQVKARNEELARAAEEQQEGSSSASTSGNNNGSGGNGGPNATRTNSADVIAYMDDYDTSIPNLNIAITMYHLQRYAAAMSILGPLYRNIEPIDETAALRVCLLILDITLASGQPGKAAEVLQYMEKAFGYLLPPAETSNAVPAVPSSSPSETESLTTNAEQVLARTSSDEGIEEDNVTLGSLEIDSSQTLGSKTTTTPLVAAREKPMPPVDVKLLLHLYRVRLFLSARNLKASKREIKSALNISRENLTALLLKAQLEYSRGNYRKAIKQLTMCIGRADPSMRGMFLSNLGCIHHRLRKDQTATLYFREALRACAASDRNYSLSSTAFSQDRTLPIVYNAGLQQLSCGNPVLASRCFQEAAALYYNRPLLWLRLAECCITALEKGLLENTTPKREVKVTVLGDGAWRRVVLPGGSLNPIVTNEVKLNESEEDVQVPVGSEKWFLFGKPRKLSLPFAIQCLQIATCLFDRCDVKAAEAAAEAAVVAAEVKDSDDVQSTKGGDLKGGGGSPTGEAKDVKGLVAAVSAIEEQEIQEVAALRMWALAALSYCQLGVGHPLRALRSAEQLLRQASCARPYMLLGHVYAAEALCHLERPQEALEHLSTCLNEATAEPTNAGTEEENLKWKGGDNSEASGDGEDGATFSVGALGDAASVARLTGTSARASLYINLAAVYAMQGNIQEAHRLAHSALAIAPTNPTAMLAAVYVELKLERMESALALLKQHRHLCVVSSCKGLSQHD